MAPDGRRQRPIKGFRPGKEPPQLRKQRAKQQFRDLSGAQKRLVEFFAERTPEESRAALRRWRIGLVASGVGLAVVAGLLAAWSVVATVVVAGLALFPLVIAWRLQRQRGALEAMADQVGKG